MQSEKLRSLQRNGQNSIPFLVVLASMAWGGSIVASENPHSPLGGVIYFFPRIFAVQAHEICLGSEDTSIQTLQYFQPTINMPFT